MKNRAKRLSVPLAAVFMLLSLLSFTSCETQSEDLFDIKTVKTYTDIPGITEEEIAAIEAIKNSREYLILGHIKNTEAYPLQDGSFTGFTYSFCEFMTELFGIEFRAVNYGSFSELMKELDNKNVDFTGGLTPTIERKQKYYMSHAILERAQKIFYNTNTHEFASEFDLQGKTIAFLANTINEQYIAEAYPLVYTSVQAESFREAAELLRTGAVDAFVTESTAETNFEEYDFITSQEFFPLVYTQVSFTTSNDKNEAIISILNKYLEYGGIDVIDKIYKDEEYKYIKHKLEKSFTDEELSYLENLRGSGGKISIAFEHDNYPISFYNEKDSEFQGIAVDIINEISNLLDIKFKSNAESDTSWSDIYDGLISGKYSMVSELLCTDARKDSFIWSEKPYAAANYALLSKSDYNNLAIYQVVRARVGFNSKTAYDEKYREWFPGSINYKEYDSQFEAFIALEKGEIDLLMASDSLLLAQHNFLEKSGYKINIIFNDRLNSFFGFNKNEQTLCSIINKTQNYIRTSSIELEWKNKAFDYSKKLMDLQLAYMLILIIVLMMVVAVILALLYKNKQLNKDIKIASQAKSAFFASMSHEIRTPLNAIIGIAGLIKNSGCEHGKHINSIDQIITSSNHLLGLLNDILDMSKIESGKMQLLNEPFSLIEAYKSVSAIIFQRCSEKNINFVSNINEMKEYALFGDKLRINQVLINLLGNAVKFTDENGEIKFTVITLEETEKAVKLKFIVSDNGIGISEEQQTNLFSPFEQANNSIISLYGGTGLGLSISQSMVKMMGGEIKVNSVPGKGSEFFFEIWLDKGDPADLIKPVCEKINLSGKRILLVEDIDINRFIIIENLTETGVEITEAENGREAVEIFNNSPEGYFDLIFMDIQMPEMNGYDAAASIRKLDRSDSNSVIIIAMTANAYKEDVDKALESGMNAHLAKPIDIELLMKTLYNYLV